MVGKEYNGNRVKESLSVCAHSPILQTLQQVTGRMQKCRSGELYGAEAVYECKACCMHRPRERPVSLCFMTHVVCAVYAARVACRSWLWLLVADLNRDVMESQL